MLNIEITMANLFKLVIPFIVLILPTQASSEYNIYFPIMRQDSGFSYHIDSNAILTLNSYYDIVATIDGDEIRTYTYKGANEGKYHIQENSTLSINALGYTTTIEVTKPNSQSGLFNCSKLVYNNSTLLSSSCGDFIEFGAGSPENILSSSNFTNTPNAVYNDAYSFIPQAVELELNSLYVSTLNIGGDQPSVSPYLNVHDWNGSPYNDNLTLDEDKLKQWQRFFEYAQENGIYLNLVLQEGEYKAKIELDNAELGVERKLYYETITSWFGYLPGLYYTVSEEYDGEYRLSQELALSYACYIKSLDSRTPVTIHNQSQSILSTFYGFLGSDCIDFAVLQLYDNNTDWIAILHEQSFNRGKIWPVHIVEPATLPYHEYCYFHQEVIDLNGGGTAYYVEGYDTNLPYLNTKYGLCGG